MKQRLGIAQALLHSPELIVLDEPTSGLDPRGMKDVRELIRELGAAGTTVFLSSHLLHEVEQVCTRAVIINKGRVVVQGPVSELRPQNDAIKVLTGDQGRAGRRAARPVRRRRRHRGRGLPRRQGRRGRRARDGPPAGGRRRRRARRRAGVRAGPRGLLPRAHRYGRRRRSRRGQEARPASPGCSREAGDEPRRLRPWRARRGRGGLAPPRPCRVPSDAPAGPAGGPTPRRPSTPTAAPPPACAATPGAPFAASGSSCCSSAAAISSGAARSSSRS